MRPCSQFLLSSLVLPLLTIACGGEGPTPTPYEPLPPPPEPPPLTRDLAIDNFSIRHSTPQRPDDVIYFCLNQDFQTKAARSDGNFIAIRNGGNADTIGYQVQIGLENNGVTYGCRDLLYALSTPAGQTSRWDGPYCCSFGLGTVPTGSYRLYVRADSGDNVTESNESNNFLFGTNPIYVP